MEISQHFSPAVRFFLLTILSLATFLIVLDYSIANVAIPYIAGDLAVGTDEGIYVITFFAVGNSIVLPITGWLTTRIGTVRLLVISLLGFVFFSFLCGAAWNLVSLVVFRFLQGAISGPLVPLNQTLVIAIYPKEKKAFATSAWAMIVIIAPIVGPILGGWITYNYVWPWIFYINIPMGLISAIILHLFLNKHDTKREKLSLDYVGLFLLIIAVTCFQIFIDKGQQYDWWSSIWMRTFAITSVIAFAYLIAWELINPKPLLKLALFKIRTFSLGVMFISVSYAIYFGTVVLIPLWLQTNMGYTSEWAGIAVAPLGILPLFLTILAPKIIQKIGVLSTLFLSFSIFAFACFYSCRLTTDVDIWFIGWTRFIFGLGFAIYFVPILLLNIRDVPSSDLAKAGGIFHFFRAISGAIGTSLFTTLWERRSYYYHQRIGETITPYSQNTDSYLTTLDGLHFDHHQSLEILNQTVNNQAAVLSINDCFYLMGWIYIGLLIFIPIGWKRKKAADNSAAPIHHAIGE